MSVSVSFHGEIESVLKASGFKIEELRKDLETYFTTSQRPAYFGKDSPFNRPEKIQEAEVNKIHLFIDGVSCTNKWQKNRTSDTYLIYTYGYLDESAYLVLGFLEDGAHKKCKSMSFMRDLQQIAENHRIKF